MYFTVLMNDQEFEQSVGHVYFRWETNFPRFFIENHFTDLIARLVELAHRRFGSFISGYEVSDRSETYISRDDE